jgi:hypothetical protein
MPRATRAAGQAFKRVYYRKTTTLVASAGCATQEVPHHPADKKGDSRRSSFRRDCTITASIYRTGPGRELTDCRSLSRVYWLVMIGSRNTHAHQGIPSAAVDPDAIPLIDDGQNHTMVAVLGDPAARVVPSAARQATGSPAR